MLISVWDEISGVWSEHELNIELTEDPNEINSALGAKLVEPSRPWITLGGLLQFPSSSPKDDDDFDISADGWEVRSHSRTGPILTIETRSDRGHLGIIIVNYESQ